MTAATVAAPAGEGRARAAYLPRTAGFIYSPQAYRDRLRNEAEAAAERERKAEVRAAAGHLEATPIGDLKRSITQLGYRAATDPRRADDLRREAFDLLKDAPAGKRDELWIHLTRTEWLAQVEQLTALTRLARAKHLLELERTQRRRAARSAARKPLIEAIHGLLWARWRSDDEHWMPVDELLALERELQIALCKHPERVGAALTAWLAWPAHPDREAALLVAAAEFSRRAERLHLETRRLARERRRNPWHIGRARGARERYQRIATCGLTHEIVVRCKCCGGETRMPVGCGDRLMCPTCRGASARRYSAELQRAMRGLVWGLDSCGLLYVGNRYRADRNENAKRSALWAARGAPSMRIKGRQYTDLFAEKFLTVTVPHLEGDTLTARLERLHKAWPYFLKLVNAFLSERLRDTLPPVMAGVRKDTVKYRARRLVHHVSVVELTEGADGLGHPHRHTWMIGPYLPHNEDDARAKGLDSRCNLQAWWKEALERADKKVKEFFAKPGAPAAPVVHCVSVRDGMMRRHKDGGKVKVADELFKYLVKDWTEARGDDGQPLSRRVGSEWMAEALTWFSAHRMRQTSRGFLTHWQIGRHRACRHCGHRTRPDVAIVARSKPVDARTPDRGDAWEPAAPSTELPALDHTKSEDPAQHTDGDRLRDRYDREWYNDAFRRNPRLRRQLADLRTQLRTMTGVASEHCAMSLRQLQLWGQD